MRCHYRRLLTAGLTLCIGTVILLNVYSIDSWTRDTRAFPWQSRSPGQPQRKFPSAPDGRQEVVVAEKVEAGKTVEEVAIWPEQAPSEDRIVAQMKYIPRLAHNNTLGDKVILLYSDVGSWHIKPGQTTFLEQNCPVNKCFITGDRGRADTADVVVFKHGVGSLSVKRPPNQIWLLYLLESPYHTPTFSQYRNVFNWTATYRHDSTIVAPYEKFVPYNASVLTKPQNKNFAAGKTKKVAWFVSNCAAANNRGAVAAELAKYIDVDIYGACGPLKCPRFQSNKCFELLNRDYKFYLAFENSKCIDYITEKFFVNGLQNDVIPIVLGARPEDYKRAAPPHSYIHVEDFESLRALADYLHLLDQNDDLYNEYFRWKGTGEFVNTYFWCRLCALAHDTDHRSTQYEDIETWWRGKGVCIGTKRWSDTQ